MFNHVLNISRINFFLDVKYNDVFFPTLLWIILLTTWDNTHTSLEDNKFREYNEQIYHSQTGIQANPLEWYLETSKLS